MTALYSNTQEKSQIAFKIQQQYFLRAVHIARLSNNIDALKKENNNLVALDAIKSRIDHKDSPIESREKLFSMVDRHIKSKSHFDSSTVPFSLHSQEPYSLQSKEPRTEPYGAFGLGPYEMAAIIEEIEKEQAELASLKEWSRTAPELAANEDKKFEDLLSFGEEVNPIVGKINTIALDVKHNHKKVVKYLRNNHTDAYKQTAQRFKRRYGKY